MGSQLRDALKASGAFAATRTEQSKAKHSGSKTKLSRSTDLGRPPHIKGTLQPELQPSTDALPPGWNVERVVVHGGPEPKAAPAADISIRNLPPNLSTVAVAPVSRLVRTGSFHPHPLLIEDAQDDSVIPELGFLGAERQLTEFPENETDMVIGLDFGTSATKVVIRDSYAAMGTFPVRLNGNCPGIEGYLLPSRVFRTGDVYSLAGGSHRIGNMKLTLLEFGATGADAAFNNCCAFLALVIRRARAWLYSEFRDVYARHQINWRVNLGLASRSYEDKHIVEVFRRLAWAAANVAADHNAEQVTIDVVDSYRRLSLNVISGESDDVSDTTPFAVSDVDAIPEVSAQLLGFMSSARWDWAARPVMMLVDIGAGTVDTALFHVQPSAKGTGRLTFWASRVEQNGVMNLHRDRVAWLRGLLPDSSQHDDVRSYLAAIEQPTDRLRPIPGSVHEYLPGYKADKTGEDVDQMFRRKNYRAQVAGSISDAKTRKGVKVTQLQGVPLLLCGGGSRMEFYAQIAEAINETPGWHVSVELTKLPVPLDLVDMGWHADDFDRISVAYGLSLSGGGSNSLGKIVRAIDVPDIGVCTVVELEDPFVSKDLV
jgi:hypothetical protein